MLSFPLKSCLLRSRTLCLCPCELATERCHRVIDESWRRNVAIDESVHLLHFFDQISWTLNTHFDFLTSSYITVNFFPLCFSVIFSSGVVLQVKKWPKTGEEWGKLGYYLFPTHILMSLDMALKNHHSKMVYHRVTSLSMPEIWPIWGRRKS